MKQTNLTKLTIAIDENYNAEQLKPLYRNYLSDFEVKLNRVKAPLIGLTKSYLVNLIAEIFNDKNLFLTLLSKFPEPIEKVFKKLCYESFNHSFKQLEKEFNFEIIKKNEKYRYPIFSDIFPPIHIFSNNRKYSENFEIYLHKDIANVVKDYFDIPDKYMIKETTKEINTNYVHTSNGEILEELNLYLKSVYNINEYASQKKILKSVLKSTSEQCGIEEFYKDSNNEEYSYLKTELIIHFFKQTKIFNSEDNFKTLKNMINLYKSGVSFCSTELIYHVKGLARYILDGYYFTDCIKLNNVFNTNIIGIIKKMPINKWVDIDNFYNNYFIHEGITYNLFATQIFKGIYYDTKDKYGYTSKEYIDKNSYYETILQPTIKGSVFLMATLGLIDIAYDKPKNNIKRASKDYLSVFDGVKYLKLNNFGAYILGLTNTFDVAKKNEDIEIKLSDSELNIYVKGKSKVKTMFLEDFADKINDSFYKVTYKSFLKDCSKSKNVENKINLFKSEISKDLPLIWREFFKDVKSRSDILEKEEEVVLYKLKNNPDLAYLFLKDHILKKYSLKVEKMMIAIKYSDLNKVRKRLNDLGYLGSII